MVDDGSVRSLLTQTMFEDQKNFKRVNNVTVGNWFSL